MCVHCCACNLKHCCLWSDLVRVTNHTGVTYQTLDFAETHHGVLSSFILRSPNFLFAPSCLHSAVSPHLCLPFCSYCILWWSTLASKHPLLIRANKYCKAGTQAGSLSKSRYYFSWTVPLSVDWGRLSAWGSGWRETGRGGVMYCVNIKLLRMLPLSVFSLAALIIQRVLCPLFQC